LARPDSGRLAVHGHDVVTDSRSARRLLGVVPQELVFDPFFTVRETLRLQSGYFGIRDNDDWIDEILAELDLTAKADTNMRRLSGGMKRRVLVAQALVHKPPVIVLDEPTAGVDVELRQGLWAFVQRLNRAGQTVILTTHYLEEAQTLCGRIAMLKEGRVVALDTTANLLARHSSRSLLLRLAPGTELPLSLQARAKREGEGDGGGWRFRLNDTAEIEPLLAALRVAGCRLEDVQIVHGDLEDVFIDVMHAAGSAGSVGSVS
jgi:ABC-2 type transport system ATP-binding protein